MITVTHVAFDTLKFVETLIAAGMPSAQAKALSEAQKEVFEEALDHTLATKSDIADLRAETKADIANLRTETKAEFVEVRTDIAKLQIEMRYMRWMLSALIFGVGSLLVKAFFLT